MSDEDIELPPLPKASKMYDIPGYDEEELKDYARTAIQADRARRALLAERDALIHDNSESVSAANELATENHAGSLPAIAAIAIGNNELGGRFEKSVRCPKCGEAHTLEFVTKRTMRTDGTWSEPAVCKSTAFYRCGDKAYMAGVGDTIAALRERLGKGMEQKA